MRRKGLVAHVAPMEFPHGMHTGCAIESKILRMLMNPLIASLGHEVSRAYALSFRYKRTKDPYKKFSAVMS